MKILIVFSLFICVAHLNMVKSGKSVVGINGKSYLISHPLKKNWYQADRHCTYFNMTLVEIATQADEDAIQAIIQSDDYKGLSEPFFWIGATDLGSEGCFYWVKNGQPLIFSNWSGGQPDNAGNEHCVEIRGHFNYLWNDHQCDQLKYFICEENLPAIDVRNFRQ